MPQHVSDEIQGTDDDRPTPKLDALVNERAGLFREEDTVRLWGFGQIREEGDLSPYISGEPDLPPKERITHQVESMITHVTHWDRVLWAIKTREGRVIVVMQQRHEADQSRVGGQVEIINAPFRDTAVKGLEEVIIGLQYLLGHVHEVRGL